MIDVLPAARADVSGEVLKVAAVRLDGVRRGVTLAQRRKELRDSLPHDRRGWFWCHRSGSPRRPRATEKPKCFFSPCLRVSVVNSPTSLAPEDDASDTHSSADPARRGCKSG